MYVDFGMVDCPVHGYQKLTDDQYDIQMSEADDKWRCPVCNRISEWIDTDDEDCDYGDQPF